MIVRIEKILSSILHNDEIRIDQSCGVDAPIMANSIADTQNGLLFDFNKLCKCRHYLLQSLNDRSRLYDNGFGIV
jgi:hypothetical protein